MPIKNAVRLHLLKDSAGPSMNACMIYRHCVYERMAEQTFLHKAFNSVNGKGQDNSGMNYISNY